jgi:hypothetical protein
LAQFYDDLGLAPVMHFERIEEWSFSLGFKRVCSAVPELAPDIHASVTTWAGRGIVVERRAVSGVSCGRSIAIPESSSYNAFGYGKP